MSQQPLRIRLVIPVDAVAEFFLSRARCVKPVFGPIPSDREE